MADRYWVGGTANWDNTAGTKWATTSGGTGGASVPTSADDVFFDTASTGTVTPVTAQSVCRTLNTSGFTGTITGTGTITVHGSLLIGSSTTWSHTGSLDIRAASGSFTITTSGKTLGAISFGFGGTSTATWTLSDALTSSSITVTSGTFVTNSYNVTALSIISGNTNIRTINFGGSTVILSGSGFCLDFSVFNNLTFNSGTSQINITATNPSFAGGGLVFYNVSFTSTSAGTRQISGSTTFNNLSFTAPSATGVTQVTFDSRQTINGTLSTTGTAGNRRVWFRGVTYGLSQTLTVNATPSLTDADFRDIYVVGSAAPISGTRIGDLRGCSGITFSTPKMVYWATAAGGNWSGNNWAASSGGAANTDNFPLAQDTAIIENTGLNTSATVTMDAAISYTGTVSMGTRTNAMTLSLGAAQIIYGNWTNGSGTTLSGAQTLTYSGRNTQTITSAGKTFSGAITVDSYSGTVELADALNIGTNTLTVTNGTFDTKNFSVTGGSLSSSNSNQREIRLGSSTVTFSSVSPVTFTTSTNLTLAAGTSSVVCTTASDSQLSGGGQTFYDVSFTGTGSVVTTISQSNIFNNLSITAPSSAGLRQISFDANQTITGTFTVAGATAVSRIFVNSETIGTARTLTVGTLSATDCDFRDITIAGTAAGSSPTRAGDCGGNTGITFPAPKTVYWNLAGTQTWSATGWAPTSGGTVDINQFPLAQDTAVFDNTGSVGTVTVSQPWNIGTLNMAARTTACTIDWSNSTPNIHGNVLLGSGVTPGTTGTCVMVGRGTQTITSAGNTWSGALTINGVTGTVQLADALTMIAARIMTLTSGTFDAVAYNVTVGTFSCLSSVPLALKMGSGTWTLSGTGTVWQGTGLGNVASAFYKGTANIVLSDTSTTARTFAGGGLSYNKLTIGGATGISTLTITGNNQFTELASTKTVAHTIALGTTTQTFGKWTVTGTVGNVVTLTGTGTSHVLAGAATSGIDYLAMGSIGFAATSPGEFYAGANSTGTASAPVYRTAPPAATTRYWVGGTGTWDATTTTNWSTSSGGAGGASVPTSLDNVIFNTSSSTANAAYTMTIGTGATVRAKAITMGGPGAGNNITWAGSGTMVMHGNFDLTAGTADCTRTFTGPIVLSGSTTGLTFTTNGVGLDSTITVNGVDAAWALASAFNMGSRTLTVTNGSFDLATYNFTADSLVSSTTNGRVIALGSSTLSLSGSAPINFGTTEGERGSFTFTAGTSQVNCSATDPVISGNNQTFYNVSFTSTSLSVSRINGSNTFNNLTVAGRTSAGLHFLNIANNQTVTGTLTFSAGTNAAMRHFCRSDTIGTTRTITAAAVSMTDVDFRDISIAGAAAPASGTRIGDCKGNSGITFTAAANKYWNLAAGGNWSATGWALTSGGSPAVNNFPLAQDTCVFEATGLTSGNTITINANYNIGTIDMSARTANTMTLAVGSQTPTIYGNWINGTGTTLTGAGRITMAGRTSQTITSAGVTFTQPFTVDSPSGTVTLQDAFTSSANVSAVVRVDRGTFDAATYNVTLSGASSTVALQSTQVTRTLAIGSGTWTVAGSGGSVWDATLSTNLTVTGTGTISLTSASAKTFGGGGIAYTNITLNQGGAGTLTITGNNTFKDITNTYKATGATTINMGTTTQRVSQWTAAGEAGRLLTIQGTSATSPCTLVHTGTGTAANVDYLVITGVRAY